MTDAQELKVKRGCFRYIRRALLPVLKMSDEELKDWNERMLRTLDYGDGTYKTEPKDFYD